MLCISINSKKALEKLAKIKCKAQKANFSLICEDLKYVSLYTKPIDRKIFRT